MLAKFLVSGLRLIICWRNSSYYFSIIVFSECRSLVCTRKRHYYDIKTTCFRQWLNWTPCSAECGSGMRYRYQFTSPTEHLSESRACNTHACPRWRDWEPTRACQVTCQQLYTRSCVYKGEVVNPSRCSQSNVSESDNAAQKWGDCLKGVCPASSLAATRSTTTARNVVEARTTQWGETEGDQQPAYIPLYSNKTFWIGCCVGVVAALILLFLMFLIYFQTKSGRLTISVIKANSQKKLTKLYSDREKRDSKNRKMQIVHADVINAPVPERRMPDPPLPSFSSLLKENDEAMNHCDHAIYQSGGSIQNHSKYIESINPNLVEPVEYETFYTPVGESKRQSRRSNHRLRSGNFLEAPKQLHHGISSESFASDSESEYYHERHRDEVDDGSNYQNDSAYYGGDNGYHRDAEPFDEKAYLRKLEETRAEKRRRRWSKEKRSKRKSQRSLVNGDCRRQHHRQESGDSQSTGENSRQAEAHYAQPMKPTKRERRHVTGKISEEKHVRERIAARGNPNTGFAEDAFEFPVPPNMDEIERSGGMRV